MGDEKNALDTVQPTEVTEILRERIISAIYTLNGTGNGKPRNKNKNNEL